jgi:hypothetical protein
VGADPVAPLIPTFDRGIGAVSQVIRFSDKKGGNNVNLIELSGRGVVHFLGVDLQEEI